MCKMYFLPTYLPPSHPRLLFSGQLSAQGSKKSGLQLPLPTCLIFINCLFVYIFITFLAPLIDKMVTVSEEWVAIAILRCVEMEKAVVEGGGASGVAAVLAGLCPELKGKKYKFQNNFYLIIIKIL